MLYATPAQVKLEMGLKEIRVAPFPAPKDLHTGIRMQELHAKVYVQEFARMQGFP